MWMWWLFSYLQNLNFQIDFLFYSFNNFLIDSFKNTLIRSCTHFNQVKTSFTCREQQQISSFDILNERTSVFHISNTIPWWLYIFKELLVVLLDIFKFDLSIMSSHTKQHKYIKNQAYIPQCHPPFCSIGCSKKIQNKHYPISW